MKQKTILVLDCGATNVRTIAVSEKGEIVASYSLPNNTQPDPENRNYRIWDAGLGVDYESSIESLKSYLESRTQWMDGEIFSF